MGCDQIREALSAQLDGEDPGLAGAAVDAHLQGCRACRAWSDGLTSVQRLVRLRVAEPIPDLTARILHLTHPPVAAQVACRRSDAPSLARLRRLADPRTAIPAPGA